MEKLPSSFTAPTSASRPVSAVRRAGRLIFRGGIVLAGILAAVLIAMWFVRLFMPNVAPSGQPLGNLFQSASLPSWGQPSTLLVMGIDQNKVRNRRGQLVYPSDRFRGARTDTMLLVRVNPAGKTLSVISLPRDSKVFLADTSRTGKLNGAFAEGGREFAEQVVEYSFGVNVDQTLVVNLEAVRDVVDALGGLELYVPQRMVYHDRADGLAINLQPGLQTLTGEEAVGFLRFRHDRLGDIGRVRRQQLFLAAMKKKLSQPSTLLQLPGVLKAVTPHIQTDLSVSQLLALANFMRQLPPEGVRIATLPGRASTRETASYWIVEPYAAKQVMNRLLFDQHSAEAALGVNHPLKLGLAYPEQLADKAQEIKEALASHPRFTVVCETRTRRAQSLLVENSFRVRQADADALRQLLPSLEKAMTVVAPTHASYESLYCSAQDDMTLLLGYDLTGNNPPTPAD